MCQSVASYQPWSHKTALADEANADNRRATRVGAVISFDTHRPLGVGVN